MSQSTITSNRPPTSAPPNRAQGKITQVQLARFLRCDVVTARQIVTECLTSTDVAADGRLEMLHLEEFQKSLLSNAS